MGLIRTPSKRLVETRHGQPLRQLLLHRVYVLHMTQTEIAEELEVPEGTIASWFQREGIQARQLAALKAGELLAAGDGDPVSS